MPTERSRSWILSAAVEAVLDWNYCPYCSQKYIWNYVIGLLRSELRTCSLLEVLMHWSLPKKHTENVIVLFKLVVLLCVSVAILRSRLFSFWPEPIIMLSLFGIDQYCVGIRDVIKGILGSYVKRWATWDLIFVGMEAECEYSVGFFDFCFCGCFGDAEYVVVVFFGEVGGDFFFHLWLFFVGHGCYWLYGMIYYKWAFSKWCRQ